MSRIRSTTRARTSHPRACARGTGGSGALHVPTRYVPRPPPSLLEDLADPVEGGGSRRGEDRTREGTVPRKLFTASIIRPLPPVRSPRATPSMPGSVYFVREKVDPVVNRADLAAFLKHPLKPPFASLSQPFHSDLNWSRPTVAAYIATGLLPSYATPAPAPSPGPTAPHSPVPRCPRRTWCRAPCAHRGLRQPATPHARGRGRRARRRPGAFSAYRARPCRDVLRK